MKLLISIFALLGSVAPAGASELGVNESEAQPWVGASSLANSDDKDSGNGIVTWAGKQLEFDGLACDLVLLDNPNFEDHLGMTIHIRTKPAPLRSFIQAAAIQIGDDKLEVVGGHETMFWVNGIHLQLSEGTHEFPDALAGFALNAEVLSSKEATFQLDLGHQDAIRIDSSGRFVRVGLTSKGHRDNFDGSKGLMGSYPEGSLVARDGHTVLTDLIEFANEWQVLTHETKLFDNAEGPPHPEKCIMASEVEQERTRRLGGS